MSPADLSFLPEILRTHPDFVLMCCVFWLISVCMTLGVHAMDIFCELKLENAIRTSARWVMVALFFGWLTVPAVGLGIAGLALFISGCALKTVASSVYHALPKRRNS